MIKVMHTCTYTTCVCMHVCVSGCGMYKMMAECTIKYACRDGHHSLICGVEHLGG